MKKTYFLPIAFALLAMMLATSCTELHESAEASLDYDHLDYKGPSPYPPPLGTPYENLCYLLLEEIVNDIFWPYTDLFYDGTGGTVYDPSNYDAGNKPFLQSNFGDSTGAAKKNPRWCILLSEGPGYVAKGGKEKDGNATTITRLDYLEVPVFANYYARMGKSQNALHVGAGPWVAYALSGKFKTTGQNSVAVKFGKNGDFTRMDYGIGVNAGVLFSKKWNVTLGYDMGMQNLLGTPGAINDGDKAHTKNLSFSIGYWFK